ncbi:adenylate kinase-like protein 1 [Plasmodium brasilianum]|uniref:Adenylate kinase isoenzyme 6 homolog n=2 Tax=Plasmodium (Plasmodium) TaxID=418103 RepID=A0A1A8VPJ8_PLAMA|nr:adenylate kinase-like protein 1, putative [Plasmodium malariae]KAI4840893.1 adenylate kinase-like protein 1 [Plasmodium brasilianum]SBS81585.1 adenylate kinase-like protein 1, putative (AKLP1) [Plasmodium malariae]SBT87086.1 adenylate kinase-like protein 1, putative [Plasmodium malariae]
MRRLPNIIVTGVPGVGKTTLCEELVEVINKVIKQKNKKWKKEGMEGTKEIGDAEGMERRDCIDLVDGVASEEEGKMVHVNLSHIIKEERLYEEYDDKLDASIYNEELVNDRLKKLDMEKKGGYIIDFHGVNFVRDKHLIDHIFLLTISTNNLYERLEKRNYRKEKITNNIECEIFQVIKEDILEHFEDETVFTELENNDLDQYEKNINTIKTWVLSNIRYW